MMVVAPKPQGLLTAWTGSHFVAWLWAASCSGHFVAWLWAISCGGHFVAWLWAISCGSHFVAWLWASSWGATLCLVSEQLLGKFTPGLHLIMETWPLML